MTDEPPAAPTSARVLGLGVMGRGIARLLAGAGVEVTVADADAQRTADGLAALEREAAADDAPVEVRAVAIDAPADVDLVIEATSEDPAIKAQVVATMAAIAGPDTMLATNTSSLSVDELGRASGVPERFVGLHFFNPPTRLPLVEVVAGTWCEPAVVDRAVGWVEALGQQAVRCVDAPGFIVNRVCRPLYGEAQRLVELGERPAVIDLLARRVLGDAAGTANSWDLWTTGTTRWPRTDGSELEVELVVHPELVLVKKRKKGTALEYLDRAVLPRLGRREPVVIGLRPEVPGQDGHAWLVVGARVGFSQVETKELGKTVHALREVRLFDPRDGRLDWRSFEDVAEGALLVVALDARVLRGPLPAP